MQLYLDSFGAYLSVRNGMFHIRMREGAEARQFAARTVGTILLTKGTAASTDALLLAAQHEIPVVLIDANTHRPLAQLAGTVPGNVAALRRAQAAAGDDMRGLQWAARCIAQKVEGHRQLLERMAETPDSPLAPDRATDQRMMAAALQRIEALAQAPATAPMDANDRAKTAETLRGSEGTASKVYFASLGIYLEHLGVAFSGRQRHPAYEPYNALLNYLYGMLYTSVHIAILKNNLDATMGFLHADRYGGKPTLAYDLIEPFRPWADTVALGLVRSQVWQDDHAAWFQSNPDEDGLWLSTEGKGHAIEAMLAYLAEATPYDGRNLRRSTQIDLDVQKLVLFLTKKS